MSIADKITRLQNAKTAIATAITGKGGTVGAGDGFEDFASDIATIPGGGGATEPYVEETYNSSGQLTGAVLHGYTKVREYAFYSCANLTSVLIPNSVTSIGGNAFRGCTNVKIPSLLNVVDLGSYAFYGCEQLALTELPSAMTAIPAYSFYDCHNIELTELPSGVASIGAQAFVRCSKLAITSIPSGVTELPTAAFGNCTGLTTLSLPSGISTIANQAFVGCTNLTTVTFSGTPATIHQQTFYNCTNLRDIYVPWADGAVSGAPWGATNATVHYNS